MEPGLDDKQLLGDNKKHRVEMPLQRRNNTLATVQYVDLWLNYHYLVVFIIHIANRL